MIFDRVIDLSDREPDSILDDPEELTELTDAALAVIAAKLVAFRSKKLSSYNI
jgi:hypothetical protein